MFGMGDTSRDCSGEAAGDISGEDMACLSKKSKDEQNVRQDIETVYYPREVIAQH